MIRNIIGKYDFSVRQGVDQVETFTDWLIDGEPLILSDAEAIRVHFKRMAEVVVPDLELTVDNGGLRVVGNNLEFVFGENTLQLRAGYYLYDILIIKGGKRYTYVEGQMELIGVMTK